MNVNKLQILLADDDEDDCLFFKEALDGLPVATELTTVHNGEQLMQLLLDSTEPFPNVLFLDLNMPRKSGFECLSEIKLDKKMKHLPVIILSTSFEQEVANKLYRDGAKACLRKPTNFSQLKQVIQQTLIQIEQETHLPPTKQTSTL